MSFSYLKKKFKKKNKMTKENGDEPRKEAPPAMPLQEEVQKRKEEEELLNQVMSRINEIENDIPRIKVSMDTLKSQINDLRGEIERLDHIIKDVMVLYEVVSQQINPFKDSDSENPLFSEVEELKNEIETLKDEIAQIKADLRLIIIDGMDLDELIYEAMSEGSA